MGANPARGLADIGTAQRMCQITQSVNSKKIIGPKVLNATSRVLALSPEWLPGRVSKGQPLVRARANCQTEVPPQRQVKPFKCEVIAGAQECAGVLRGGDFLSGFARLRCQDLPTLKDGLHSNSNRLEAGNNLLGSGPSRRGGARRYSGA